jgi:hypothetical protein
MIPIMAHSRGDEGSLERVRVQELIVPDTAAADLGQFCQGARAPRRDRIAEVSAAELLLCLDSDAVIRRCADSRG